MRLSFHGADRVVTGSCHMLECGGQRILIDCGMLQGSSELDEENAEPFGFDPAAIDYVLLTHAHLDHCGRLPLLVNRGFCSEMITTTATMYQAIRTSIEFFISLPSRCLDWLFLAGSETPPLPRGYRGGGGAGSIGKPGT